MIKRSRASLWLRVAIGVLIFSLSACSGNNSLTSNTVAGTIPIVAAENFYGDIARQIGGDHVSVTSILADPNVDPHEYTSNVQNAIAIAKARLVIENGGGYDDWMDKMLSAQPDSQRIVLQGFQIAQTKLPENEHVWYSIDNAQLVARRIADSLKQLDPAHAASFERNDQTFNQSLQQIRQKIAEIKLKYAGTPVGLTETIYLYQTGPLGLRVLTPIEFQKAMAEGNDPPATSVVTADTQIVQHQIKVLIYNEQTITGATTKLQNDAKAQQIPVVPVTETMPPHKTYQGWMLDQLESLEQALGK